jgi:hypothetical protein
MHEILQKIKTILLEHSKNAESAITFEKESENELEFLFQGNKFRIGVQDNDEISCEVQYFDEDGQIFEVNYELEAILKWKLSLEQEYFTIGVSQSIHVNWKIDTLELEEAFIRALDLSKSLLTEIVTVANDSMPDVNQPVLQATGVESTPSPVSSPIQVICSAFDGKDWKYKVKSEPRKFILEAGFVTKDHKDSDNDNYVKIVIFYNYDDEVIFLAPYVYNVHKSLTASEPQDQDKILLRRAKLSLLSLYMTTTYKFITMWYDEDDGEVRLEVRQLLGDKASFSVEQTIRGVTVIRQTVEKLHLKFAEGVMNDEKDVNTFSESLFPAKSVNPVEYLASQISANIENIDKLSQDELTAIAGSVAAAAKKIVDDKSNKE